MKKFAQANEEQLFVKKESVEGTLEYPGNNDALLAVGVAATNQEDEFLDDAQVRERRSRSTPIKARTNPGTWGCTTYVKPSGVPGTPPEADVLFECAMGSKNIYPGFRVEYTFDSTSNLPSFSFWRKVGHTVYSMAGCTVNTMEITISGADIAQVVWGGEFMKWWYAGTDYAAAIVNATDTTVTVTEVTRFSPERARINLGADNNGGDGYLITGINYDTNVITFTPQAAVGCAEGAAITGWYPSAAAEVGAPVHGKLGIVTIDSTNTVLLDAVISLANNIKYYVDEKNGQLYPTVYGAPGFRDVTATLRLYFYKNMPTYFYRSSSQIQDALIAPAGNVSGKIMEVSCPRIEYKTPTLSGDEEVMVELAVTAVGSASGDDEMKVTFK